MKPMHDLRIPRTVSLLLSGWLAAFFFLVPSTVSQDAGQAAKMQQHAAMVVQRRTVPSLQGRTLADVRKILHDAGLQLGETSWGTAAGTLATVYAQTPAAGATVVAGSRVNVSLVRQNPQNRPGTSDGEFTPQQKPPQKPAEPDREFYTRVPELRGHTPEQAAGLLHGANLGLGAQNWGNASGTPGTIYNQDPPAGRWVLKGTKVNVWLVQQQPKQPATPPPPEFPQVRVPDILHTSPEDAESILRAKRLRLGGIERHMMTEESGVSAGLIIAQKPQPGTWVAAGTPVSVLVAVRPKPAVVPDVVGSDQTTAAGILSKSTLHLGAVQPQESSQSPGVILQQDPPAGTRVKPGTAVGVIVAVPTKMAIVPYVIGRDQATAAGILSKSGLQLGAVQTRESNQTPGIILQQDPPAGTSVKPGTAVNVLVARQPEPVPVPNIVGKSQTAAAGILNQSRLRLGTVETRESDENPGIILEQNPPAGTRVRPGTAVGAVVSRATQRSLIVEAETTNPEISQTVTFHARLTPAADSAEYRFAFGDGAPATRWRAEPAANHVYQSAGTYQAQASARVRGKEISSRLIPIQAREADFTVELVPDKQSAKPLEAVTFTARLSRADLHPEYQFEFGDGGTSGWLREVSATHSYQVAGQYRPRVRARVARGKPVESLEAAIEIPPPLPWKKAAQVAGLLALGAGVGVGLSYLIRHGRPALSSHPGLVRVVPNLDLGKQQVEMPEPWSADVILRFRAISSLGDQTIEILGPNPGGEAGAHG